MPAGFTCDIPTHAAHQLSNNVDTSTGYDASSQRAAHGQGKVACIVQQHTHISIPMRFSQTLIDMYMRVVQAIILTSNLLNALCC